MSDQEERCHYCSSPAEPGQGYCSAACDLARRLPLGEKDLPATWQLGVLLGWCFIAFNQILFFGMGRLARGQGDLRSASLFEMGSMGAGALVLLASFLFFAVAKPKTRLDQLGFWGILLGSVALYAVFSKMMAAGEVLGLLIYNLLTVAWLTRGLWQGRASKKTQKR
ncbi:hypothetical protein [Pelagicoccus sp. SDUM812003]|uniref:hypothetical protein n=1 Tax=Pelagicoccus sp. SDUM812003 TaxID=3041267 RepID=UPI00280F6939|nr:hypothetical protein [Pelagicoccus sp. SDUM812003]MDQ8205566.1 hypothetical protein [Pelagicoccus sp. SDUM812003]